MNDRLNVEMIDTDAPLTLQTRAALALNSTRTERDLVALAAKNVHIVAVIDKDGRSQAHGAAMELKAARVTIEKVSKAARDDAVQFGKAIIQEEKRLVALVEPEENRLIALRDAWDTEQARIKAEAEAKERARITAIHANIAEIRNFLTLAGQCRTAERIQSLIEQLERIQQAEYFVFEEFAGEAETAAVATFDAMVKLHAAKLAEEEERARLKAEGEAAAARLAEQRKEQEAQAAELAAERAAIERERAELAAAKAAAAQVIEDAKPKVDPVEQFEREMQAMAAAITPQPVVIAGPVSMSPAMREQFDKTYPVTPWAPSDVAIVDALVHHFNKSHDLVITRLAAGFDIEALRAEFEVEA